MGEALGAGLSLGTLATLSTWLLGPGNPLTWKTPGTGLEETLPGNRQDGGGLPGQVWNILGWQTFDLSCLPNAGHSLVGGDVWVPSQLGMD